MLDQLHSFIVGLSSDNKLAVAGMYTAATAWIMATATFMLRHVPQKIISFLKNQLTTSATINNYQTWQNERVIYNFSAWYQKNKYFKFSRSHIINLIYSSDRTKDRHEFDFDDDDESSQLEWSIGPGTGTHWFVYEGSLFWFKREIDTSNQSAKYKETFTFNKLGRSKDKIFKLFDTFSPIIEDSATEVSIMRPNKEYDDWDLFSHANKRGAETVVLRADIKNTIINAIESFHNDEEWYVHSRVPYKLGFMLHGEPGTGKTSIAAMIASHLGYDLYTLSLNTLTDNNLSNLVSSIKKKSVLLIEDIDAFRVTNTREGADSQKADSMQMLTLSGILNALDGIVSLHGLILIMTTNHINSIDPAMRRKGRVNFEIEIPRLTTTEIKEYVKIVYGEEIDGDFVDVTGADLQNLVIEHKRDFTSFKNDLNKMYLKV